MKNTNHKVMFRLVYHFLNVQGIEIEPGGNFKADRYAKGISKLYRDCNKNEEETKRRITVAGEYFNSKGLSWTVDTIYRDWDLIQKWIKKDAPQEADVSARRKL